MLRSKRFALVLLLVGALGAGLVALSVREPYRAFQDEVFVELQRGSGTSGIASTLERSGVIRYAWQFWLLHAIRPSDKLQAGEYRFSAPASALDVFDRIARGDVYYIDFVVPEGSNMFDIARSLESTGAMPAEDFLRAAADPSLIRDLAPKAQTLEGYLFPATYRLQHSTTAAVLCRQMTAQFRLHWKKLAEDHPGGDSDPDVHRVVTLASMVEKETGVASERPIVAGVFTTRLRIGMRLECDPTTIYAALLDNRFKGTIHRSDLASSNPYNTYQNAGLPPGPIANPGADAIAAALHPAETEYLYFVAKLGGGGHQFSANLAAHQKAVQAYRHGAQSHDTRINDNKPQPKGTGKTG